MRTSRAYLASPSPGVDLSPREMRMLAYACRILTASLPLPGNLSFSQRVELEVLERKLIDGARFADGQTGGRT